MGRHSNVITINGDGDILSCAYQTGQAQTRVRPLSVGGAYTLPPVADGLQVRCCTLLVSARASDRAR